MKKKGWGREKSVLTSGRGSLWNQIFTVLEFSPVQVSRVFPLTKEIFRENGGGSVEDDVCEELELDVVTGAVVGGGGGDGGGAPLAAVVVLGGDGDDDGGDNTHQRILYSASVSALRSRGGGT